MSGAAVAKRYAKALFEVASEKQLLDTIELDLKLVTDTFSATPELVTWLAHPATDPAKKKELFSSVFKNVHGITQNLLFLLADRRRENIIDEIAEEFTSLSYAAKGLAQAVVTSALPLSEEDKQKLIATFQPIIGKTLQLTEVVDSNLLGGVVVQIGDRLYDGSLKTKLLRFQERLKGTRVG